MADADKLEDQVAFMDVSGNDIADAMERGPLALYLELRKGMTDDAPESLSCAAMLTMLRHWVTEHPGIAKPGGTVDRTMKVLEKNLDPDMPPIGMVLMDPNETRH